MKETEIKTVLDVAAALNIVGPQFSNAENAGGLIALARGLHLCGDWNDRDINMGFLVRLADAFGMTNDGADAAEVTECNKRFLVGLALELCVIGSDDGRASLDYGPNYSAVELDHDLIIDLYKSPDRMDMVRAAVDAIAECTPLVVLPEDRRQIDECR